MDAGRRDDDVGGQSRSTDVRELAEIVARWHEAFEGFRFELHAVTSSGDTAAVHATLHGINVGVWQGREPTRQPVEVEHMFFRFDCDAITDVWELLDRPAFEAQLEPPTRAPAAGAPAPPDRAP